MFANKPVASLLIATALSLGVASAQSTQPIRTHIISSERVEQLATSLDHISVIQLPEPVVNAAIGSDLIHMEFRGNTVLIEPTQPGVRTDLFVWTAHSQMAYEILPAAEASGLSYAIRETYPPPPPPPPGPTPEQAQTERDESSDPFLLSTRRIKAPHFHPYRLGVNLCVTDVAEDDYSYYVRMRVFNSTAHLYRVSTPKVFHLSPLFGAKMALTSVNEQLTQKKFNQVYSYDSEALLTHGSTLETHDLRPGESVEWVMAVSKPQHVPAMYEFAMPSDGDDPVRAVVVF